jgi:hypothetical protein
MRIIINTVIVYLQQLYGCILYSHDGGDINFRVGVTVSHIIVLYKL